MFVDHIVLPNVSHNDDRFPDSLKAKDLLRGVWETLSWRRVVSSLSVGNDYQPIATRLGGLALCALGRSLVGVIAWRTVSLLVSFL